MCFSYSTTFNRVIVTVSQYAHGPPHALIKKTAEIVSNVCCNILIYGNGLSEGLVFIKLLSVGAF